ncbi:MAG: Xaa-Pro peptidase family protein [Pseudomonadota bacterium]
MDNRDARHTPKIDPGARAPQAPLGFVNAEASTNPAGDEWAAAGLPAPDMDIVRAYRLERIREQLRERDFGGCLLYDPLNLRYALDATNMQIWTMHNAVRYAYIATDGPVILFDFHACEHLSEDYPLIDETRPAIAWFYFGAGQNEMARVKDWASEIAHLVNAHGGGNKRLAIDTCDQNGISALEAHGIACHSSFAFCEEARKIKHPEELKAMRRSILTSEIGAAEMWRALKPGITENQLWSILHQVNIARGGEWIETRLLASGERTNPWMQECSDRVIGPGDTVGFDTDLVGPYGYCSDISRTWICPGGTPTNEQISNHAMGMDQIAHNAALIKPGLSFFEFAAQGYTLPEDYFSQRYGVVVHGVGLCDEYPAVAYPTPDSPGAYDGEFIEGMCICVETYIGRVGGKSGCKMERQGVVTATGFEFFDTFPLDLTPDIDTWRTSVGIG